MRLANIPVAAQYLVIAYGASHAFELIATTLLAAGDAVLVEDPGYFVLPAQLRNRGFG